MGIIFQKHISHIGVLKIKAQLPNLTSNFETHKNDGGNFFFTFTNRSIHDPYTYKVSRKKKKKKDSTHPSTIHKIIISGFKKDPSPLVFLNAKFRNP